MGLLERWDRHNQAVMDRHRRLPEPAWSRPTIVWVALSLGWIAGRIVPTWWLALIAWLVIASVASVALVRDHRRRRAAGDGASEPASTPGH